jgi:glycosyltransferase involved in cell wall biosynthesis
VAELPDARIGYECSVWYFHRTDQCTRPGGASKQAKQLSSARVRPEVVIIQRRLTHYRVPLFESLRSALDEDGIALRVLHGAPTAEDATRRDEGRLEWAEALPARDLLGERLCWQPYGRSTRDAELVIVTQEIRFIYHYWAQSIGRVLGRPRRVALWGHGANLQANNLESLRERFRRHWMRRADWWFAYSALTEELVRRSGFAPERITNVENSIDTRALAQECQAVTAADLDAARKSIGLEGARVGVFIGSLHESKRLSFLIEAGARIARQVPHFRLLVSGDGPQRPLIEDAVRTHPWLLYTGMLRGRNKAITLRLAEIMLNPGLVGLGILDAFTAGLPLLTTDCGIHSPEIAYLRSGENGIMTPDSLEAFADAAVGLLGDERQRSRLGASAQTDAARLTIENTTRRFREGIHGALRLVPVSAAARR